MASSFNYMISQAKTWSNQFDSAGYNANCHTETKNCFRFDSKEWENSHLISYQDHGSSGWAGIYSNDMPYLNNSLVFSDACSTCSSYDKDSFCNNVIRKGGLMHAGAVSIAWTNNLIYHKTMNGIYYYNKTIGEAFKDGCVNGYYGSRYRWMTTLFGDPTFHLNPPYLLSSKLYR